MPPATESYRPTRRERRPTERITAKGMALLLDYLSFMTNLFYTIENALQEKQKEREIAQAKANANKKKKARKQQQAVEREQFNNQENLGKF